MSNKWIKDVIFQSIATCIGVKMVVFIFRFSEREIKGVMSRWLQHPWHPGPVGQLGATDASDNNVSRVPWFIGQRDTSVSAISVMTPLLASLLILSTCLEVVTSQSSFSPFSILGSLFNPQPQVLQFSVCTLLLLSRAVRGNFVVWVVSRMNLILSIMGY